MRIIVCVKAVPNPALPVEFDTVKNTVKDTGWNYILNPYDEAALEAALRLKDSNGAAVSVITLGPARSEAVLRKCLAMGADDAARIDMPDDGKLDGYATAQLLANAIRPAVYDIVLCGARSTDRNAGEVGGMLAEFLGLPVVNAIVGLTFDPAAGTATVLRRLERGARERKRCKLPALFTADLMLNEPRYPTWPGRQRATGQEIRIIAAGATASQLTQVTAVTKPPPKKIYIPTGNLSPAERLRLLTKVGPSRKSSGNTLSGDPADIAEKTVAFLKEKRLLP